MSSNAYNCGQVKLMSSLFKLLAVPSRLNILCSLSMACRPVTDIVAATELSQTNVSFHLRALREAGLVRPERRGAFIYYCLSDAKLLVLLEDMQSWVERRDAKAKLAEK